MEFFWGGGGGDATSVRDVLYQPSSPYAYQSECLPIGQVLFANAYQSDDLVLLRLVSISKHSPISTAYQSEKYQECLPIGMLTNRKR